MVITCFWIGIKEKGFICSLEKDCFPLGGLFVFGTLSKCKSSTEFVQDLYLIDFQIIQYRNKYDSHCYLVKK